MAKQKFIGHRRDTLDMGETVVDVALGQTFEADSEHPEVKRALAIGSIQPVVKVEATKSLEDLAAEESKKAKKLEVKTGGE